MRTLIVYESMFGNTRDIAEAVAEGLGQYAATDLVEVGDAPEQPGPEVDLLVVGGPTHALGMSRHQTRADAANRASTAVVSRAIGLREWLDELPRTDRPRAAACFDTRAQLKLQRLTGSAARGAAKRLRRRGYHLIRPSESFLVEDMTGPLVEGEIVRAHEWGSQVGESLTQVTYGP